MSTKLLSLEAAKRNAILNAALKEFALKGFDKASTNTIARDAKLSKPLMFHYVDNKQALFLSVYDYFSDLLDKEYFMKIDFTEKDIFDRLRQSYLLQIELIKLHPWIFEFSKLSCATNSEDLNKKLEARATKKQSSCENTLFKAIDESKFRKGLNIEKCMQFILWANVGFTNQILDDIRNSGTNAMDYDLIVKKLDDYFDELRKVFYTPSEG
ncbi:MAG: TetR/AcrR family transcriptional regulator [Sphaerochaeta sp.]|nr:TetR/AcrR family transcriptional regulator [Sphaerochaeta sp.]